MEPGKRLPGKVAIVTGGSSGIGEETARVFARHGASVVLCDLQDELGGAVASEINAAGGTAEYRHLDVTQEDEWTTLVDDVEAKYGRIDVLCNIAGIGRGNPIRPPGIGPAWICRACRLIAGTRSWPSMLLASFLGRRQFMLR